MDGTNSTLWLCCGYLADSSKFYDADAEFSILPPLRPLRPPSLSCGGNQVSLTNVMMQLRKVCCHPLMMEEEDVMPVGRDAQETAR